MTTCTENAKSADLTVRDLLTASRVLSVIVAAHDAGIRAACWRRRLLMVFGTSDWDLVHRLSMAMEKIANQELEKP